jgi:hypothetical protein
MDQAWVVAVDMGYGHQRAAYPFRDIACERVITANTDASVSAEERTLWLRFQGLYESVSRVQRVPVVGPWLWRLYDSFQAISPHYPFRDLSQPTFGSMRLQRLLRRGFGGSAVQYTRSRPELPLLTTFFAIALAADRAGRPDVFCVVTDTDINRIWVAEKPRQSRIVYLAPTPLNRARLLQYGVPPENVFVTGFPLPEENIRAAAADLRRRLTVLDAGGNFRRRYEGMLASELGGTGGAAAGPLSITYAVGGAGAQAEMARDILASLARPLRDGRMRLNLVAGTRPEVERSFREAIAALGLEPEFGRGITILCAPTKDEYFARFNLLLHETDVLWTKPSELCFYAALGLPIVMSPPLGAHEVRNQQVVMKVGAGQKQEDPRAAAEWLTDWCRNGLLAFNAFNGYLLMPREGTANIKRLLFAADRSRVDLGPWAAMQLGTPLAPEPQSRA